LQLKVYGLSPYIGYKFSPFRYKQENIDASGFKTTHVADPFDIQDRATHLLTVGDEPRLLAEVDANLEVKADFL
jgi:hypothetical protein